jgi:predicted enzyme related to lactoylglutathione lyase
MLFDLSAPGTPKGTPPHVGVVLEVESAEATRKRVDTLGGIASPAFELMGQGKTAVCIDPKGAEFDVLEARNGMRTGFDRSLHGAPGWFELTTSDVERAATFYSGLFGWTPDVLPVPGSKYAVFKLGERCVAGLLNLTPHMGSQRPHWATFFTVKDIDLTTQEAVRLGATLCVPVLEVTGFGRFCGITSPQGLTFYVITYARRESVCEPSAAG